jgi:hypothetical protein
MPFFSKKQSNSRTTNSRTTNSKRTKINHNSVILEKVEFIVDQCIPLLNTEEVLKTEGLFRVGGKIIKYKELVKNPKNITKEYNNGNVSIADITSALKQALRGEGLGLRKDNNKNPKPIIIPDNQQNTFLDLYNTIDIQAIKKAINDLPSINKRILGKVMKFLNIVQQSPHKENKMTANNLAVIFGMILLPADDFADRRNISIVELIIKHADTLFDEESGAAAAAAANQMQHHVPVAFIDEQLTMDHIKHIVNECINYLENHGAINDDEHITESSSIDKRDKLFNYLKNNGKLELHNEYSNTDVASCLRKAIRELHFFTTPENIFIEQLDTIEKINDRIKSFDTDKKEIFEKIIAYLQKFVNQMNLKKISTLPSIILVLGLNGKNKDLNLQIFNHLFKTDKHNNHNRRNNGHGMKRRPPPPPPRSNSLKPKSRHSVANTDLLPGQVLNLNNISKPAVHETDFSVSEVNTNTSNTIKPVSHGHSHRTLPTPPLRVPRSSSNMKNGKPIPAPRHRTLPIPPPRQSKFNSNGRPIPAPRRTLHIPPPPRQSTLKNGRPIPAPRRRKTNVSVSNNA